MPPTQFKKLFLATDSVSQKSGTWHNSNPSATKTELARDQKDKEFLLVSPVVELQSRCHLKTREIATNPKSEKVDIGLCVLATEKVDELANEIKSELPRMGKLNFRIDPLECAGFGCTDVQKYTKLILSVLVKTPSEIYQEIDIHDDETAVDLYETPMEGLMVAVLKKKDNGYVHDISVMDTVSALKISRSDPKEGKKLL